MVSADASVSQVGAAATDYPPRAVAWYAVFILTVCYTLAFVDRQILAFLVGPLKADLHMSDTQIGLLQGAAFALFYTFLGLPMGMLADRMSRRNIIAWGVFFWSLMTSLSAFARSAFTLTMARMGLGLGEATLNPCAFSMVTDYFPKERLATAMSVYTMGIQIGSGLAMIVGGLVTQAVMNLPPYDVPLFGEMAPWRVSFLVVGVPGVLITLLILTMREPPRRALLRTGTAVAPPLSIPQSLRFMKERWRSIFGIAVMIGTQAMANYALLSWGPAFFERVHGWSRAQIGLMLGIITLVCGCLGLITGGRLADRWHQQGIPHGTLRVGLINLIGVGLTLPLAMLLPNPYWTIAMLVVAVFFIGLPIGTGYAALQVLLPNQTRGFVTACVLFVVNLFGLGLGAALPSLFTDFLFRDENMVGYSISLSVALACLLGATVVLLTIKPYRQHYALMHPSASSS